MKNVTTILITLSALILSACNDTGSGSSTTASTPAVVTPTDPGCRSHSGTDRYASAHGNPCADRYAGPNAFSDSKSNASPNPISDACADSCAHSNPNTLANARRDRNARSCGQPERKSGLCLELSA
jgi:hypothetical protein